MKRSILYIIIVAIVLIAIGILFWPTIYRYDETTISGKTFNLRFNRFNGHTEYFVDDEWYTEKPITMAEPRKLPIEELKKIEGYSKLGGVFDDNLYGSIYNGSSWNVTGILFRVILKDKDSNIIWNRVYYDSIQIKAYSNENFSFPVMLGNVTEFDFDSEIEYAYGFKANVDFNKFLIEDSIARREIFKREIDSLVSKFNEFEDSIIDARDWTIEEFDEWLKDSGNTVWPSVE